MCGIYGELSISGRTQVGGALDLATDRLAHRGPDDRGTWLGDGVCLGARRLSIIDLAAGRQPMWNEDGTCCIVYNGELYNFLELGPQLRTKGHTFRTASDTEVVLHAYEEWGPACVRRFNGMFAFAVWDGRARTLFLARDRIGEKPLYYWKDGDRLRFASEIKAILADRAVPRRLDPCGLANFLAFGHAVAPDTIYEGIRKLLPGHSMVVRDGRIQVSRYWDIGEEDASADVQSEAHCAEQLLDLLTDSVSRRMVADVPVGAFLSGGIDSSAVVALMTRSAAGPVETFSLGFGKRGHDELSDARRVACQLGTEHREYRAEPGELPEAVRSLVYHYDEPFGDPAAFPVYVLARFAREHVKVVLTGDGGDELFGGYRRYVADQLAPSYQRLPAALIDHWIPGLVDRLPRSRRVKSIAGALRVRDAARRYSSWLTVFDPELRAELLHVELRERLGAHHPEAQHRRYYGSLRGGAADHLNRLMYVDLKSLLPDAYLEKTDKATMAAGLEARMPFLDHRLVELAFRIPARHKIRGLATKRVLRHAVTGLVPPGVSSKRKQGFAVPLDSWFRGELRSFASEVLTDERTRRRGYFDQRVVDRLWREHATGRHARDACLWLLLNLELWHRAYLDGEAA